MNGDGIRWEVVRLGRQVTAKGLQTYLGIVNFFCRFLWGAAKVLSLLSDALKGGC